MLSPAEIGANPATQPSGAVPRWYNPLDSAAIDARIAAGGLWAWRAQANDNVTWGPGPGNYAASLISVEGGAVALAEIGGGSVNWAALTGWSGFSALNRCLDTGQNPAQDQSWIAFIQYSGLTNNGYCGIYDTVTTGGLYFWPNRLAATVRYVHNAFTQVAPNHLTGNLCIAGRQPYRNGVIDGGLIAVSVKAMNFSFYIGALNNGGVFAVPMDASMQAVLICDDATAFAAPDITAIAAFPAGSMHNL